MWGKLEEKYFKVMAIGIILLSLISSGIFAYYNHPRQQEVKKTQDSQADYNLEKLLDEARSLYYQGEYKASIAKYKQILEYEDNKSARENLAAIYEELGEYELASKEYERLVKLDKQPKYRLDLAAVYYNLDKLLDAEKSLKELLEYEKVEEFILRDSYYQLSLIESRRGNYEKAKAYVLEALSYEEFAIAYRQLGDIEFAFKNYQEAVNNYNRALKIDGSLVDVNQKRGLAYLKLEDFAKAAQYLKSAAAENKNNQEVDKILDALEEQYPEYFVEERRVLPEEIKKPIPDTVTFKKIEPLELKGQEIKVGIMNEEEEAYFRVGSDFVVSSNGKVIAEGIKGELIKATFNNGEYILEFGGKELKFDSLLLIEPKEYAPVLIHNVVYGRGYYWGGVQDRQYRGALELLPRENGITVVNRVGLEEYLLAVVPSEMHASWETEALKVQAVAARSYTLSNLGRFKSRGYDLCDTVMCAAYNGINKEHPNSTQAVIKTAGEVATYNGKPINAVYSANSGGHTENSEDVWSGVVPYLRGVSTETENSDFPLSPMELKDWLRKRPDSYSGNPSYTPARNYRWQRSISIEYLENSLGIKGIKSIRPTGRGQAGSVISLLVVGENDQREFKSNLRSRFGGLRSNRFWIQPQYENGKLVAYKFYGSGWGHSVGMDQVAVAGMVDDGYSYQDILKYFYTNTTIEDRY